jgi:hypothetical protein
VHDRGFSKPNAIETEDGGYEQLISNGERFKPAFAERDKKQTMLDLRGISTNWFENQFCPSTRLSRLRAQRGLNSRRPTLDFFLALTKPRQSNG